VGGGVRLVAEEEPAGLDTPVEEKPHEKGEGEEEEESWWDPPWVKWSFHSQFDTVSSQHGRNDIRVNEFRVHNIQVLKNFFMACT
jgi:hypothetical protein